jgi:hypothetical protein
MPSGMERRVDGRTGYPLLLKTLKLFTIKIIIYCTNLIIKIDTDSELSLFAVRRSTSALFECNQNVIINYNLFAWILIFSSFICQFLDD